MNVTFGEGTLFYDLYVALLSFANGKLGISTEQFSDVRQYVSTPIEARLAVRDALFTHRELIDQFVAENPAQLSADKLEIAAGWKHALAGKFYVLRYLAKYAVFLTSGASPNRAYGVLGLADPLAEVLGPNVPRLVHTVLLPFRDKIIYDGLVSTYNISFGGGVKRSLNEAYKQAKEAFGIITSLGDPTAPAAERPKKPRKRPQQATRAVGGPATAADVKTALKSEHVEQAQGVSEGEAKVLAALKAAGGALTSGELYKHFSGASARSVRNYVQSLEAKRLITLKDVALKQGRTRVIELTR